MSSLVGKLLGILCGRKIAPNVATLLSRLSASDIGKNFTTQCSSSPVENQTQKKNRRKKSKLLNVPRHQLDDAVEIASLVISTRELAIVTMTRNLVISTWKNHPIAPQTKKEDMKIAEYFKNVSESIEQLPDLRTLDYFVIENKYWFGKKSMNHHFLIAKSILHTLFSAAHHDDPLRQRVVYMQWLKTGKVFDLTVDGNIRKSGKEKTAEILKSGHWLGRPIYFKDDIVTFSDAGVKVKRAPTVTDDKGSCYEYVTEEMSDAFLQALAFWHAATKKL